jgi:hypothetical protein
MSHLMPVGDVSAPSEDDVLADVVGALELALSRLPADSDWTNCLRTVHGSLRVRLGLRSLRSVSEGGKS